MKQSKQSLIHTRGKRKRAVARATLNKGKGNIKINGQSLDSFGTKMMRLRIAEPLILAGDVASKVNCSVNVHGGGSSGQADAIRLAIARALVEHDENLKKIFTAYDRLLLVADVRQKEVCKPNDSKARAKRQKSYR
ncbi:30S ribosomal protein S9 [archaeon]|jgi:small subunit ribosomal protein S9|nr:30S ribosomal protein S9 [archaeon]MBT6761597.1 30S ribosomal protein S9 [archaeon]